MKEARSELVRINDKGEAHPIGNVASQRMRAREGAYRMLPAPGHVIFMRYTGEDGRRDEDDGAIVKLSGEITQPGTMCDIISLVAQSGWGGEMLVVDGLSARSLFFEAGNVIGAQTTVDDERLGMIMYRFGAITPEQHEQILAQVESGSRFGAAAVELSILSQEQVFKYLRKQSEEIAFACLGVGDGTFFFLNGFDDSRVVARQNVSANAILMDGVTRIDEVKYFRQRIPSSEYVPQLNAAKEGAPPAELADVYAAINGLLDIEDLGRETGRGEFQITKDVYALLQSRHVLIHPPPMAGGLTAVVAVANEALRLIHQEADSQGKGTTLRAALVSFAAGAGVYDSLFSNAGPDEGGLLNADATAKNAGLVADADDAELYLKQMLHEYVSFGIFSAGATMGEELEAKLKSDLSPALARLQPQG